MTEKGLGKNMRAIMDVLRQNAGRPMTADDICIAAGFLYLGHIRPPLLKLVKRGIVKRNIQRPYNTYVIAEIGSSPDRLPAEKRERALVAAGMIENVLATNGVTMPEVRQALREVQELAKAEKLKE